jgi:Domain of unknown function (DUF4397)
MPFRFRWIALLAITPLLVGCGDDNTAGPDIADSRVRFVHAVADTGAIDVRVNAKLVTELTGVSFGVATDYASISTGLVSFSAQPSPSTTIDLPRPVANINSLSFQNGASVTLVVAGESRDTVSSRAAGITAYIDDVTPPAAGQARLRVINSSPDAGAVDVYASLAGNAIGTTPTFAGVDFRSPLTRTLPAASYVLTITALAQPATVLATSSVALPDGGVQTVVVRGYRGTLPVNVPTTRRISATVMVNRAP